MIIMAVRNNDNVYGWNVFNLTWNFGVPLGSKPAKRTASLAEDRIEEHSKTSWELDKVTCMAKPCGTKRLCIPGVDEGWLLDRHGRR